MTKTNQSKKTATIMQILPNLESGGVERGVVDIAKEIKRQGFESIVVSNGGTMVRELLEKGIKHISLPVNSKNPFKIYQNIKKLVDIIKENGVDIAHVRSRAPSWSVYFACKKTGCKMVSTIHGPYSVKLFTKKPSPLKLLYNSMMLKADAIIAVSAFIKNYIKENYGAKFQDAAENAVVIHRGVDLNHFDADKVSKPRIIQLSKLWNLPDDKSIIMLPGRITSWKGHEFLIDALTKVKNRDFLCVMVGSDKDHENYEKRLEERVEKNDLAGKVRFIDAVRDMPAAYMLCDLVISASVRPEAFGRVAIEAGAMGRVIIATNIGGSLETVIDGKTGFLVKPNDIDDMAQKIDHVLSLSDKSRAQICQNAKKHITENFSNQKMYDKTTELYHRLIK
ncbi:MAG: glycosyltransferase family 4 protein [Proteobacteria bacterium]|nr:glycosyltransferase family 4 protein [Pseudomonadota bacterium]